MLCGVDQWVVDRCWVGGVVEWDVLYCVRGDFDGVVVVCVGYDQLCC